MVILITEGPEPSFPCKLNGHKFKPSIETRIQDFVQIFPKASHDRGPAKHSNFFRPLIDIILLLAPYGYFKSKIEFLRI